MTQQGDSGLQRKPELRLALLSGSGGMYLAQVPEHATSAKCQNMRLQVGTSAIFNKPGKWITSSTKLNGYMFKSNLSLRN